MLVEHLGLVLGLRSLGEGCLRSRGVYLRHGVADVHPIVRTNYPLRIVATPLALAVFASAWCDEHTAAWQWALVFGFPLVHPHAVYLVARASRSPKRVEWAALLLEGAIGGGLIALVGFAPAPTLVFLLIGNLNGLLPGGPRILAGTLATGALTALGVGALTGFELRFASSATTTWMSFGVAIVYFLGVGLTAYDFGTALRRRRREIRAKNASRRPAT